VRMDPFVLAFYAAVCGGLGWAAPNLGSPVMRLGIGAIVGVIAAIVLPFVRSGLGF